MVVHLRSRVAEHIHETTTRSNALIEAAGDNLTSSAAATGAEEAGFSSLGTRMMCV